MPPPVLGMRDIRSAATAFAHEWKSVSSEDAEAKSFWDGFFNIFGVSRLRVAAFEHPVRQPDGGMGYIDLLWKGILLVEHKSAGRDLDSAYSQAKGYFHQLKERDLPKFIVVSDFKRFRLYDLQANTRHEFTLAQLPANVELFGFMSGYHKPKPANKEKLVDIEAAERLGKLHDALLAAGYDGHKLELLLVRILFCLFAEDNALFERRQFQDFVESQTREDGSDLGAQLNHLFQTLDTAVERRPRNLPDTLATFPYVNGELFSETLPVAQFGADTRESLLECCAFDWSGISPEIFGSLFQSIMSREKRRELGAHYTSEENILKALRPLFLDALEAEFLAADRSPRKLAALHDKLASIRVLDPACGCGNFLVVAYRELRRIELEVVRQIQRLGSEGYSQMATDITHLCRVDVDQMGGIEVEEFPAQVARVALWLTDHQANRTFSMEFGDYYARLPLRKAAKIIRADSLETDWLSVFPGQQLSYIVGNPPFIGSKMMEPEQRAQLLACFHDAEGVGILDYVSAWYAKAADVMVAHRHVRTALVSTNSITQGEQVAVLWGYLLGRGIRIHFAHRTFRWTSEAKGKAAVHCVIIGMGYGSSPNELVLYDYDTASAAPVARKVSRISPYLIEASDVLIGSRSASICKVPEMVSGNKPIDGGHYLFTPEQRRAFLEAEPEAERLFRRWLGGEEFINGIERYFLLASAAKPDELRQLPNVCERIENVRAYRVQSDSPATVRLAQTPTAFHVQFTPRGNYLAMAEVSSERRIYAPIAFLDSSVLCGNKLRLVNEATLYHFGILTSLMHMAWMRVVSGRLELRYQYSVKITYNNFPWPSPTPEQKASIESKAQAVLDARAVHTGATLADLYDPNTMPANLAKAHADLDRAVDKAYGKTDFPREVDRVEFLFGLYERLTAELAPAPKPKRARRQA